MSIYSDLNRVAADIKEVREQVKAISNAPQSQRTSVEGGSIDFNDADGNLMAIVGGQDDGSNTIRHVDGPTPPIPSGLSAHVDGPIVQVSWDGSFEDADSATWDWSHLEVVVVGPGNEQLTATINDITGASTSVAATVSGEWDVFARSVSRAEKRSLDGDAGTVEVKITDISGAISAVQDSANGKNKVHYEPRPPTPADPGIFDDTWFVGQVGRPNDIIEATNLAQNPRYVSGLRGNLGNDTQVAGGGGVLSVEDGWVKLSPTSSNGLTVYGVDSRSFEPGPWQGRTFTVSVTLRLDAPFVGSLHGEALSINFNYMDSGGTYRYYVARSEKAPNVAGEFRLSVTGAVPVDARSWFVRFVGGSSTTPTYWTDVQIEEGSAASPYFDGDTESGATDNESHYRWTGEPHASASEKYLPALDIGESDNWNVVEQWRHNGTGWERVELSHHVFSTVDLGKATVGELDGVRIMGQTIRGQQLSGDAIDGKVITGPIIQSAREGQRWVGDTTGIRIFNADNEVRTQLSPDGSAFKGEVEAETLVVNDGAELKGNNTLAQGAKFTLAAGVTDPTAPPVVQPYWEGVSFEKPYTEIDLVGLAFDGTNYWSVSPTHQWPYDGGIAHAIRVNSTTGDVQSFGVPSTSRSEYFGVTCIGSELFWLYRAKYDHKVLVTDLNCVKLREFAYPDAGHSASNPLTYRPGIGNDGTNVAIAQCTDAGELRWRTYNKTTGALLATVSTGYPTASDLTGVRIAPADFGATRVVIAKSTGSNFITLTTAGVNEPGRSWDAAAPESTGIVYADGRFRSLDPAGFIHEYSDVNTGDGSDDWWAAYYWYTDVNDDDIIGSSDYESRMSPPKRFTWPRRAGLKILGQPMPTGVEALGPALAKKTSTPARADFSCPEWLVDSGKPSARYVELPTNWRTSASPSETNTFPETTSSALESASGTFRVLGDGSGKWGPLTFNADGTMSGVPIFARGTVAGGAIANGGFLDVTVDFPAGKFSSPPAVTVSNVSPRITQSVEEVTATSFRTRRYNWSGGNANPTTFTWIAIGGI